MSVDEAFRKLMQAVPGVPAAGAAMSAPMAPPTAVAAGPAAPAPVQPERPPAKPLDLEKIRRMAGFKYDPIDTRSQIAEEYRILRTRLQALKLDKPSVLLTSCHHNEGKTNTALRLALTMAKRRGSKILLVDFDLRRPTVHKLLGLPGREVDIVSVLRGKCAPEEAMLYSEEDNLYVLCAKREYSNGTDYLETRHARELLDRIHATFDFTVMDSCPCLSTSDPAILGPYVGGVVMVIRSLQTQRESIEHAILSLSELGVPTIGVILTFMRYFIPRYLYRYQYYHGYYYYRGRSYGAYGAAEPGAVEIGDDKSGVGERPPLEEEEAERKDGELVV